ncbi:MULTISPECIES: HAD-IA family hydrolase [unclassified Lysobacter]|uniref:HAD family hydrolase n=1 Tax=unclassified Lysobacter TaxID=2635362 RepID=UPI001BED1B29|nr:MULTISPECIES: HAD-IA family hydrolase [unclassified Lysobacter]MBT2745516.1 HAD-IA family hydrolase [Lysobacter sp. ISL-42]MBT2753455.1 HAD-IA family hydrolase [Lysobacter sp. ISL-50]MBT2777161.1 HAD-IA family hydrolase [Lysobacter sp. ISL-54]MBT2780213.1 HAD-IA family hydrolase [Lysobacter sp. ISL-52]
MSFPVRAITLDLDDTVWPIAPVMLRAEGVLDDWLRQHAPNTAQRFPVQAMRALRDEIAVQRPDLAHDYTTQRRLTLERMLRESGDDIALAAPAFDVFFAARCEVEHYADSEAALQRLAARLPLAALTNGNADLVKIGLMPLFRFQLGAREHGRAKPDASIFHAACSRLELEPAQVLHVGDDIELDIVGGAQAGLRTCWINREDRRWPHAHLRPDLEFTTLAELADWLDTAHRTDTAAA